MSVPELEAGFRNLIQLIYSDEFTKARRADFRRNFRKNLRQQYAMERVMDEAGDRRIKPRELAGISGRQGRRRVRKTVPQQPPVRMNPSNAYTRSGVRTPKIGS